MSHHIYDPKYLKCEACDAKLLQADLKLRVWFLDKVKPNFPEIHIAWSYRNEEDQNQAFLDHKSKVKYPNSLHNKKDLLGRPASKALDLFVLDHEGAAHFPIEVYQKIAATVMDPKMMRWGGEFKNLKDFNHFELSSHLNTYDRSKDS